MVLVFDDLHISASALSAAKREAVRFVRDQAGPRDQVAEVILLLATNDYMTGDTVTIDGGLTSRIA